MVRLHHKFKSLSDIPNTIYIYIYIGLQAYWLYGKCYITRNEALADNYYW